MFFITLSQVGRATPCHVPFRTDLEARSLRYFLDNTHPVSGLIRDRASNFTGRTATVNERMASLSATGFGIAVIANAAQRKLVPKEEATARALRAVKFVQERLFKYRGWLYHFVDWETGKRYGGSEISTIDSALFFSGLLYAASVLDSTELKSRTEELLSEVDYVDMMTNGGSQPKKLTLSMGWSPEIGYLPPQWDHYAEHLILVIMGLGSTTHPLPITAWQAWKRIVDKVPTETIFGKDLSLFVHQYSHLFIDFKDIATPKEDFFTNSRFATLRNQEFCKNQSEKFQTFKEGFWGLSASDSPMGYAAFSPAFYEGTVCPGCVGGSAMFLDCPILSQLETWSTGPYRNKIWGVYGFSDSLNLDQKWFDEDVIGITVGALYLSLANTDPATSLWKPFHAIPEIRRGLARIQALNSSAVLSVK